MEDFLMAGGWACLVSLEGKGSGLLLSLTQSTV
jgi:hypothetical protein